ncbi:MAG TPA: hypothetical protein PKO23_19425 [Candidatus Hydrogenedentes bacterium]|nr:hypothetical protein [Candidatus Hydrogenedentota bacterium]
MWHDFLYTKYVNRMHHRSGHLWQNRFYSCAMDDAYYLKALCYLERNPVWARLADHAWDYAWSSARAHCVDDAEKAGRIYRHTTIGRPLGSDSFLSRLESVLGRRARTLPVGWPKGWRKKK